ncbi:Crp/Fnr family transcriptional regulator [Paenibacillus sp. M1]|uniref:Crp/Fnr family transcriptional regulator n=1 Tax=Paenibacillus haidiansis TaxID=1574488 RepID=A0ABU7VX50_9BACL
MEMSVETLRRFIPLFRELDDGEAEKLCGAAITRLLPKRTAVIREGEEVEAVYFILQGLVKTFRTDEKGNEQIFSILKSGEVFPLTCRFDEDVHPATAVTVVETQLLSVPVKFLEGMFLSSSGFAYKMMGLMSGKIRELQDKLLRFNQRSVEDRGIAYLIQLAEHFGVEREGEVWIPVPMTHQELASTIGFTRESVSRLLTGLRKEGILMFSRKGFIVKDLLALKAKVCVKENCPHCRELMRREAELGVPARF